MGAIKEKVIQMIQQLPDDVTVDDILSELYFKLQFDSEQWDRQIGKDIRSGKLDKLAEKSITAHRAGRSKKL